MKTQSKKKAPDNATVVQSGTQSAASINRKLPFFSRKVLALLDRLEQGKANVTLPDNTTLVYESGNKGPVANIIMHNWDLPKRAALGGTIGVAESFMDGDWSSPNVTETLELFLVNEHIYADVAGRGMVLGMVEKIRHWLNANTKSGSKRNIAAHYDLGNDFYKLWLDPSMTYSSAIYADGANSLKRAQDDKYRSLATRMGIEKDSHVLEIGCGWGGFAEFVATEIGARVTGLTISQEQLKYARERIKRAKLEDRVEFKFQDYRDERGTYDHIASIEMFEAVGEKYWPVYFGKISECLKPGGTAGLQIITIRDNDFETYRSRPDFIQRYIFPGGMLPSPAALAKATTEQGLQLMNERIFPQDYAKTLEEWRIRFQKQWSKIKELGFDARFKRMWEFYLHYCEAGFKTESIDVRQVFYSHQKS